MPLPHKLLLTVTIAITTVLALLATPALAGCCGGDTRDPDDVRGKLDIAEVQWAKSGDAGPMTVTVVTHDAWRPRVLRSNRLIVAIDADADREIDYRARIRRWEGRLLVFIDGSGSSFEPLPARRPDARTVRFTIPGDSPPNPPGDLELFARSRYVNDARCSAGCVDRAPDRGRI